MKQTNLEKYHAVRASVAEGMSKTAARKKHGMNGSTYHSYLKKYGDTPNVVVHAPEVKTKQRRTLQPTSSKCVVIVTSTSELAGVLRSLQ
jgi:hypothetical protein